MPELRELIEGLGYTDVETLVQSGNVVFTSRAAPATLEKKLEQEIEQQLGVDPAVVVRTRDELAAAIEANPFEVPPNPKDLHVTFLSGEPDADAREKLEAPDFGVDRLALRRPRDLRPLRGRDRPLGARQAARPGEARRRRHRPQLEHGHEAAGDVLTRSGVDRPRGDDAADRAEQVALPGDARRGHEPANASVVP